MEARIAVAIVAEHGRLGHNKNRIKEFFRGLEVPAEIDLYYGRKRIECDVAVIIGQPGKVGQHYSARREESKLILTSYTEIPEKSWPMIFGDLEWMIKAKVRLMARAARKAEDQLRKQARIAERNSNLREPATV